MRKGIVVLLALVLGFLPSAAFAWNATGHMTVAELAWRELSDQDRQKVAAILKQHPHYKSMLVEKKPDGVDEAEWVFLRASSWPDMVRPARPGDTFKSAAITRYH